MVIVIVMREDIIKRLFLNPFFQWPCQVHHHQPRKSHSNPTRSSLVSEEEPFNAKEFEDWLTKVESSDFPTRIAQIVNQNLKSQERTQSEEVGSSTSGLQVIDIDQKG